MPQARCPRFPAALAATILTALCPRASGQSQCSVEQELSYFQVTGRFTVGAVTASLTLPQFIRESESPSALLAEVTTSHSEPSQEELMIRSGPEAVPLRDGAAVHVAHHKGERTIFSIATVEGKELCSWQPPVVFFRQGGPIPDSFNVWRGPARMMHLTGDPIGVLGVHAFSDGRQEFRLDGEPARILFETPIRFLLRDPHPAAGVRTLESRGKTAPVYFVDAEKRLVPSSAGRETLEITLSGWRRDGARRGFAWPPFLMIINLNPQAAKMGCGILHGRREQNEKALLPILASNVRDGSANLTCEVRLLQSKPANIGDFVLSPNDFVPQGGLLPFLPLRRF